MGAESACLVERHCQARLWPIIARNGWPGVVSNRRDGASGDAAAGTRPVLVVDDDEGIREFVRVALGEEGYRVLVAPNGQAALDLLQVDPPGLILLDLWMPQMDGAGFLAVYRSLPIPRAPVVIFAASADVQAEALPADVAGFLAKPVELVDLLDLVARYTPGT